MIATLRSAGKPLERVAESTEVCVEVAVGWSQPPTVRSHVYSYIHTYIHTYSGNVKSVTTCSHSCVQTICGDDNLLLFIIIKAILKSVDYLLFPDFPRVSNF